MKLTLSIQYREQPPVSIAGAFIPGTDHYAWLQEMNRWGLPLNQLKALAIPANKQSVLPAGLFVIFPVLSQPDITTIRFPYQAINGKLFIPATAQLTPAVSASELSALLIWTWQLFHPTLGFIGFEEADIITVNDLLSYTPSRERDWEYARNGLQPPSKLRSIRLESNPEDFFAAISSIIGSEPLSALTETNKAKPEGSFFNQLLNHLSRLLKGAQKIPPGKSPKELEQKRKSELEKLLRMFEEDADTALRYAIPLNSPYASRGVSLQQSDALQERAPRFSLNGLGGGKAVDVWDTYGYNAHLTQNYEKLAQAALEAGEYHKAAYIYAHLLGNFAAAANVLEQGGYYREAAILYQQHLNNPATAAACLEKGGLLLEAIDMYILLQQYEKAADLYLQINQPEIAMPLYNKTVQTALNNHNILLAAKILQHKLNDTAAARKHLLDGWNLQIQANDCLRHYFQLSDQLATDLQTVYQKHLPEALENNFLEVLRYIISQHPEENITLLIQDIAYEIIGAQSLGGNYRQLRQLKEFQPSDHLLQGDWQRFIHQLPKPQVVNKPTAHFKFAADVQWKTGIILKNQALIIGNKRNGVYLLRFNLINRWEYSLWPGSVPDSARFTLISDARYSNRLLIHSSLSFDLRNKKLKIKSGQEDFNHEILVGEGKWLPEKLVGACFTETNIITLHIASNTLVLSGYTYEGALEGSKTCILNGDLFQVNPYFEPSPQEIIYWHNKYYVYVQHHIYSLDLHGRMSLILGMDPIQSFSADANSSSLNMVAATDNSIVWINCTHLKGEPQWQRIDDARPGTAVKYITGGFIVAYRGNLGQIYLQQGNTMTYSHQIVTETAICAVLPVPSRGHVALMETSGELRIYDLQQPVSMK
ncbi:hypothetical protein ACDQ55_10975 [Chitinophaga sp. 30R24]|uniref:hypothetical protein n=1 Tax=Chitinophaga sp. 30R24 TaxID=3248838 RepID=UPI003B8F43C8